jgi:TetR/AcrR family fatty acid metabolism transcriptional regulator
MANILAMQPEPVAAAPPERTFIETARRNQIVGAALDTIAEVGYARASMARIAARAGISRGLISYHFAGKDDLIRQAVHDVVADGMAYMRPRILAETTASGFLRSYIESNLGFMRDHRNQMVAIVEIARNGLTEDGRRLFYDDADVSQAVQVLRDHLARFQEAGELRPDFDPKVMAVAIRAAIDAVPPRMAFDPEVDVERYARELATTFHLATRRRTGPPDRTRKAGS